MRLIDYIESTGTQYINTGVLGGTNIDFEVKFQRNGSLSGWGHLVGAINSDSSLMQIFGIRSWAEILSRKGSGSIQYDSISFSQGVDYTVSMIGSDLKINGTTVRTLPVSSFTTPCPLYIFAADYNNTPNSILPSTRLYYAKIWDNGTLVRDFVPAVENGHAGLYDAVTGQFYSNAGTGDFMYPAWYMGEDGFPTTDYFPELPENAANSPFPAMMWRIDPKMNGGFPFHGLLPDVPRQSGAFENASRLSRVIIPESVKTIGDSAFQGTALTVVRVAADCTFGEGSFPENCRILRYPAHTHGQLTDDSGRVVLDRQGRRIYARRIDNG